MSVQPAGRHFDKNKFIARLAALLHVIKNIPRPTNIITIKGQTVLSVLEMYNKACGIGMYVIGKKPCFRYNFCPCLSIRQKLGLSLSH